MPKWSQHLVLLFMALAVSLNIANDAGERRDFLAEQLNKYNLIKSISSEVNAPRTLLGDLPAPAAALYTGSQYTGDLFEKSLDFIFPKNSYKNLSYPLTAEDLKGHGLAIFSVNAVEANDILVAEAAGYTTERRDGLLIFKKR